MSYRILRDGVEVAQVHNWPEKYTDKNKLSSAFSFYFCSWVTHYEPATYQLHFWEAIPR